MLALALGRLIYFCIFMRKRRSTAEVGGGGLEEDYKFENVVMPTEMPSKMAAIELPVNRYSTKMAATELPAERYQ